MSLYLRQELSRARTDLERAISIQRLAWGANKQNAKHRKSLYVYYQNLCIVQVELQDHQGLAASAQAFPEIYPQLSSSHVFAANWLCRAVAAAGVDARLREKGEHYADKAVDMLRRAMNLGFSRTDLLELKSSSIYAPLRHRPDFRRLFENVEKTSAIHLIGARHYAARGAWRAAVAGYARYLAAVQKLHDGEVAFE
jgi:hypothetical protein